VKHAVWFPEKITATRQGYWNLAVFICEILSKSVSYQVIWKEIRIHTDPDTP
jgi:hypothetical protein